MDFGQTQEQRALLDSIDRFIARHLPREEVRRRDTARDPPHFLLPLMGEMGLLGLAVPQRYGGAGGDWVTLGLVQERLGYHGFMAAVLLNRVVCFGAMSLLTYGSEEQRQRYLPRLTRGEMLVSLALTEPGAGSDAGAIVTRAEKIPGGWRINGRKTWISGAESAEFLVIPCRTEPGSTGAKGVTLLMVPPRAKGVAMTRLEKLGNHCSLSWDIGFDDVEVPDDAVLGGEGKGFANLMATLHYARAGLAHAVNGTAQAAVDDALAHAKTRVQFGRPIGKNQVIAHRLADMQMRVDASRLMAQRLSWMIDQGLVCRREAAQAKLVATEALKSVTEDGMQILASAGYADGSDMQRYFRDARLYTFGEGSSEILRDIIARDMGL